jgi:protein SCO1/2
MLEACTDKPANSTFESTDVTGANWETNFSLTDHNGKIKTLQDFKGNVVLLFFGFTHCPDICPTTMAKMSEVMKILKDDAQKVKVLFVTVDPERDTAKALKDYVSGFNPDFLGLYTTRENTDKLTAQFKAYSEKVSGKTEGDYMMNHSAFTYAYDGMGRLRLMINSDMTAQQIAKDLQTLLKAGPQ